MINWINIIRWIHILSGAAWLGEVITINLVLIPTLKSISSDQRPSFIRRTFPRLFRLASILSVISISSGILLSYLMSGWENLSVFFTTRWGLLILIGGFLGLALTVFHFVVESRLEPIAASMDENTSAEDVERVIKFLRFVPGAGLLVIVSIFILMMVAARGI